MIRKKICCFFITKEGERQRIDYCFHRSDFPKEMRPITVSCVWRGRSCHHTGREWLLKMPYVCNEVWEHMVKIWGAHRDLFSLPCKRRLGMQSWGYWSKVGWSLQLQKCSISHSQMRVNKMLRNSNLLRTLVNLHRVTSLWTVRKGSTGYLARLDMRMQSSDTNPCNKDRR